MYNVTWSANKDIFTSSLLICFHMKSFNCLIDLGRTSDTILNRDVESKQIFFFLFLVKKMLAVSRHCFLACCNYLHCVELSLLCPLYHVVDYVKGFFFATNDMIMWFLSFWLFIQWAILINSHMLNNLYISGMKPPWSWLMISLQIFYGEYLYLCL